MAIRNLPVKGELLPVDQASHFKALSNLTGCLTNVNNEAVFKKEFLNENDEKVTKTDFNESFNDLESNKPEPPFVYIIKHNILPNEDEYLRSYIKKENEKYYKLTEITSLIYQYDLRLVLSTKDRDLFYPRVEHYQEKYYGIIHQLRKALIDNQEQTNRIGNVFYIRFDLKIGSFYIPAPINDNRIEWAFEIEIRDGEWEKEEIEIIKDIVIKNPVMLSEN